METNLSIIQNNIPVTNNWKTTQIIDTAFIDDNHKEHHIYVTFEKNEGLGGRFLDGMLGEELTVAIRLTIENLFKEKLVASHCVWKIYKDGEMKNSCLTYAPIIYKNDVVNSTLKVAT
jgi:hypothetical protein